MSKVFCSLFTHYLRYHCTVSKLCYTNNISQFYIKCNSAHRQLAIKKDQHVCVSPFGGICETCKERSDGIGIEVRFAKLIATYNPVTHTLILKWSCAWELCFYLNIFYIAVTVYHFVNVCVCRSAEQTCLRTPRSVSGVFRQSVLEVCEIGNKKRTNTFVLVLLVRDVRLELTRSPTRPLNVRVCRFRQSRVAYL